MKIPFEIIIVAIIAVLILAVVIAVIIKKRNQEIDDDYQWSSEKRSASNIRSSHIASKLGATIFIFAFVAACAIHLLIWLSAGPSEDIVALCAKPSFFEGKIVLPFAFFVSVLFAIIVTEVFEVFIAILTKQEIKKITKPGTLLGFIIFFLVGTAIFTFATFKYEVITEEGYESHSLLRPARCYQWEDMASFTYDDDERFWNDIVAYVEFEGSSKKFKLKSRKFKILTDAACEKYNDDSEAMFDYIFLEKYAYINEQSDQETN